MIKAILVTFAMFFSIIGFAGENQATDSVVGWLTVVDSGKYEESWNLAAPFFQSQISSDNWEQALAKVRAPLGNVLSRKATNTSSHSSLPGVPSGKYVVVTLSTDFEFKKAAIETVTVQNMDAEWLVVGYFIK